ncbi:DUF1127 domain-containing protein [Epibacterium sp. SM1969]|uniref:DUF1127 domain-containing protein n=1 Tax=Tritonibacter aquimaris TaxID=2663379 RepID=A0A844AXY7_9RHOB|nr:DUF1127 domain-containing protein [Tritonibacter aquimaris]MQY42802.1 DUF1127 domain-containing protein [Tritonibacter aquimaris]
MAYLTTTQALRPARRSVFSLIANLAAIRRQRKALLALSDEALDDLGLTRAEVNREAARGLWDLPRC